MDDDLEKSEKLANIAEIILFISVILILAVFFGIGKLTLIIMISALPVYLIGYVIAIVARNTCKECTKAKEVLKCYNIVTIVLIVLVINFVLFFVVLCKGCESALGTDGIFDEFLNGLKEIVFQ
jgi:peptidoglycan/LPS O-acetylase OafA/YrhL